jgi:hypothetical protein
MAELCYFVPATCTVFENWRRVRRQKDPSQPSSSFSKSVVLRCTDDIEVILVAPTTSRFTLSIQHSGEHTAREISGAERIKLAANGTLQCILAFVPPEEDSTEFFYDNFQDAISVQTLPQRAWVTHRLFGLAKSAPRAPTKPEPPSELHGTRRRPSVHKRQPDESYTNNNSASPAQSREAEILASLQLHPSEGDLADQATEAAAQVRERPNEPNSKALSNAAAFERTPLQHQQQGGAAARTRSADVFVSRGERGRLAPIRNLTTSPQVAWDFSKPDSLLNATDRSEQGLLDTGRSSVSSRTQSPMPNKHSQGVLNNNQRHALPAQRTAAPPTVIAVDNQEHAKAIIAQMKCRTRRSTSTSNNETTMPLDQWNSLVREQGEVVRQAKIQAHDLKAQRGMSTSQDEREESVDSHATDGVAGTQQGTKVNAAGGIQNSSVEQDDRMFFLDWLEKEKTRKDSSQPNDRSASQISC